MDDFEIGIKNECIKETLMILEEAEGSFMALSMNLRMLPLKPLIHKLQRVVRDTARSLGKDVQLDVLGEQLEIDKSVLDRLSAPLIRHLKRAILPISLLAQSFKWAINWYPQSMSRNF